MKKDGIGARLIRKEDDRYMRGRGQFVGDIKLAGMQDAAFVRSPVAHAKIKAIKIPDALKGKVFTMADLTGVQPITAVSALPGFKRSSQPVLADKKVRHVGEMIAMCIAATRAEAEDMAAQFEVEFDVLPAVYDMLKAQRADAALVHEEWGDNVFLETLVDDDMKALEASSAVKVTREFQTSRQCMSPIEGRGALAIDRKTDANFSPVRLAFCLALADLFQTNLIDGTAQSFGVVARIKMFVGDVVKRHLLRAHEVFHAHVRWLHVQLSGDRIDHQLHRKTNPGSRNTAIGQDRRFVGGNRICLAAVFLKVVHPGQDARHLCRFQASRKWIGGIGSRIDGYFRVEPQQLSFCVGIGRHDIMMLPAIRGSGKIFAPVLEPADRVAEAHRRPGQAYFLGQQYSLVSKPAANVGRDDTSRSRRHGGTV